MIQLASRTTKIALAGALIAGLASAQALQKPAPAEAAPR